MAVRALLLKSPKRGSRPDSVAVNLEPLGLMCIAAFVRKFSAHAVSIIDAQAESAAIEAVGSGVYRMGMADDLLRERIRSLNPDVVGISALFEVQEADVINIARVAKSVSANVCVVVGGLDAGIRYRTYLESGVVDLVVRGDGEETFLDVLERVDRAASLSAIPGTCERLTDGTSRMNPPRVQRVPFDDYPYPDRDAIRREMYQDPGVQRASFPFARESPTFLMQASRGCRLRCAFCDIVAVHDQWTAHSPEYVVGEMQHLVDRYGAREIVFVDDNFMLDQQWALRVFDLIIACCLDVSLDIMAGVAVWTLSEAMIDRMLRAGVYRVCLPIESGNPDTIRFIKKPINLRKAVTMIDYCNRRGLYTFANLILGFPFETEDDIRRTIAWGNSSGLDAVHYFIATPLPGARMYAIYEQNDWITRRDTDTVTWRTRHFTRDTLEARAQEASRAYLLKRALFYLQPAHARHYLVPKISSWRKLRYALKIARHVLSGESRRRVPMATSRDDRVLLRSAPFADRPL